MRDPANRAVHLRTTAEILSAPDELAREMRLLARPWGFDLGAVAVPVSLWVGERDTTHPPRMSHRLAARLPQATVHVVPDSATFGLVTVYDEALRFCLSPPAAG